MIPEPMRIPHKKITQFLFLISNSLAAAFIVLVRKMELRIKEMTSAMGKANQTKSRRPDCARSHAAGRSTIS